MRPHRWQPTRFPCPWDSPCKNTGVGCHFLLPCMTVKSESEVAQLCPTLSDPMDCSPPDSSVHGIFQARVLDWVVISSLRKLSTGKTKQNLQRDPSTWEDEVSWGEWVQGAGTRGTPTAQGLQRHAGGHVHGRASCPGESWSGLLLPGPHSVLPCSGVRLPIPHHYSPFSA